MTPANRITIETTVHAPVEKVWSCWTEPEHIMQWNAASPDWHTPRATNDLREGGKFTSRMEAKDGSAGFDFEGVYSKVEPLAHIVYAMSDGRAVDVRFEARGDDTHVIESFDPESENSLEMQRQGWQSILDNFKKHTEAHSS